MNRYLAILCALGVPGGSTHAAEPPQKRDIRFVLFDDLP